MGFKQVKELAERAAVAAKHEGNTSNQLLAQAMAEMATALDLEIHAIGSKFFELDRTLNNLESQIRSI